MQEGKSGTYDYLMERLGFWEKQEEQAFLCGNPAYLKKCKEELESYRDRIKEIDDNY